MIADLLGRLHPLLVHLPIGILLLGLCFELLSANKRLASIRPAIPVIVFWGMISAVLSCLTGLALDSGGDYEQELVQPHQWAGIGLAIISIILFVLYRFKIKNGLIKAVALVTLALLFVTGHLGGTITHGEGFLSFNDSQPDQPVEMKPIPDIQQSILYTDVVQPLLKSRCYSCHGTRKQKGKLRLDQQEYILKGGENGKVVTPGKAEESEMIERLLLPMDDDDHMPPKGKPQLAKEQIEIIRWWVSTGANFQKRVSELEQTEHIKPVLLALQSGQSIPKQEVNMVPKQPVEAGDSSLIAHLTNAGVSVSPVARESNYLTASVYSSLYSADTILLQLVPLKKQLIALKMDGVLIDKDAFSRISELSALRMLQLSNTAITDESVLHLEKLSELRSLNLVGTSVTGKGILQLKSLKHLKYLYMYKTGVTAAEADVLKTHFAGTTFNLGNYTLPVLKGDTSEVKY